MITYKTGSIFDSSMQTIVNPVNCVGVMGGGLALAFKEQYPLVFLRYKMKCDAGELVPGSLDFHEADAPWEHNVLNFPTKNDFRKPSEYGFVRSGLEVFVKSYKELGITSIAFPALGCGLGGLDWNNVQTMMEKYLNDLDIPVEIYTPQ